MQTPVPMSVPSVTVVAAVTEFIGCVGKLSQFDVRSSIGCDLSHRCGTSVGGLISISDIAF